MFRKNIIIAILIGVNILYSMEEVSEEKTISKKKQLWVVTPGVISKVNETSRRTSRVFYKDVGPLLNSLVKYLGSKMHVPCLDLNYLFQKALSQGFELDPSIVPFPFDRKLEGSSGGASLYIASHVSSLVGDTSFELCELIPDTKNQFDYLINPNALIIATGELREPNNPQDLLEVVGVGGLIEKCIRIGEFLEKNPKIPYLFIVPRDNLFDFNLFESMCYIDNTLSFNGENSFNESKFKKIDIEKIMFINNISELSSNLPNFISDLVNKKGLESQEVCLKQPDLRVKIDEDKNFYVFLRILNALLNIYYSKQIVLSHTKQQKIPLLGDLTSSESYYVFKLIVEEMKTYCHSAILYEDKYPESELIKYCKCSIFPRVIYSVFLESDHDITFFERFISSLFFEHNGNLKCDFLIGMIDQMVDDILKGVGSDKNSKNIMDKKKFINAMFLSLIKLEENINNIYKKECFRSKNILHNLIDKLKGDKIFQEIFNTMPLPYHLANLCISSKEAPKYIENLRQILQSDQYIINMSDLTSKIYFVDELKKLEYSPVKYTFPPFEKINVFVDKICKEYEKSYQHGLEFFNESNTECNDQAIKKIFEKLIEDRNALLPFIVLLLNKIFSKNNSKNNMFSVSKFKKKQVLIDMIKKCTEVFVLEESQVLIYYIINILINEDVFFDSVDRSKYNLMWDLFIYIISERLGISFMHHIIINNFQKIKEKNRHIFFRMWSDYFFKKKSQINEPEKVKEIVMIFFKYCLPLKDIDSDIICSSSIDDLLEYNIGKELFEECIEKNNRSVNKFTDIAIKNRYNNILARCLKRYCESCRADFNYVPVIETIIKKIYLCTFDDFFKKYDESKNL